MNEKLKLFLGKYGLSGTYNGGNDSGGIECFELEKDDELTMEDKEYWENIRSAFEDWVYDHTLSEYGGWAWNGDAHGTITYNKETETIIVEGCETSDEDVTEIKSISINLLDFLTSQDAERIDSVNLYLVNGEESRVRINIINGPWTDSLQESESKLLEHLEGIAEEHSSDDYRFYMDDAFKVDTPVIISIGEIQEEPKSWELDLNEFEFTEKKEETL